MGETKEAQWLVMRSTDAGWRFKPLYWFDGRQEARAFVKLKKAKPRKFHSYRIERIHRGPKA